ncbi:MAG: Crp/Fnr family transcriptional regulator [Crocinitomicaceae bacterium]|nr:Crp/Fnr family transcriptional regulator [Crocinitomicaceae bacterium]
MATSGELLGHRAFGGNWEYPISALVLEDVEVLYIPLKVFETMVKADANFSFHMMMFFAEELRKSEAKIKHYPVKNLVARAVLDNYRAFGFVEESDSKIDHTLSRRDYASMAGTTYETVVRSLAQMKKDQIIDFEGKSIHILDLDKLQNLAHPPYKKAKK